MVPEPWQSGQISAVVPGAQPLPWQTSHSSLRVRESSFSQPKAASSKRMVTEARRVSPFIGPLRREELPPPKPPPEEGAENVAQVDIAHIKPAEAAAKAAALARAEVGGPPPRGRTGRSGRAYPCR